MKQASEITRKLFVGMTIAAGTWMLTACGSGSGRGSAVVGGPSAPSTPIPMPTPYVWTGRWVGTATDRTYGTAPADMDIVQSGSIVTGLATVHFVGIPLTGAATGVVTDTTLILDVPIESGACTLHLDGARAGNVVSGTVVVIRGVCSVPWGGTFSMAKQ